jgi:hypothetical protein
LAIPAKRPTDALSGVPAYMNKIGKWVISSVESVGKDRVKALKRMFSDTNRTLDTGSTVRYLISEGYWNEVRRKFDSALKKYEQAHKLLLGAAVQDFSSVSVMQVMFASEFLFYRIRRLQLIIHISSAKNSPMPENTKVVLVQAFREQYRWYTQQIMSSPYDCLMSRFYLARQSFVFGKALCEDVLAEIQIPPTMQLPVTVEERCKAAFHFRSAALHLIECQVLTSMLCSRELSFMDARALPTSFTDEVMGQLQDIYASMPSIHPSLQRLMDKPAVSGNPFLLKTIHVICSKYLPESIAGLLQIFLDSVPKNHLRGRAYVQYICLNQLVLRGEFHEAIVLFRDLSLILRKDLFKDLYVSGLQRALFSLNGLFQAACSKGTEAVSAFFAQYWEDYLLASLQLCSESSDLPADVRLSTVSTFREFLEYYAKHYQSVEFGPERSLKLETGSTLPFMIVRPIFSSNVVHVGDRLDFFVTVTSLLPPVVGVFPADAYGVFFKSILAEFRNGTSLTLTHLESFSDDRGRQCAVFHTRAPTTSKTQLSLRSLTGTLRFNGLPIHVDRAWNFPFLECVSTILPAPSLLQVSFEKMLSYSGEDAAPGLVAFVMEACRVRVTIRSPTERCGGGTFSVTSATSDCVFLGEPGSDPQKTFVGTIPLLEKPSDVFHAYFTIRASTPGTKTFHFEGVYESPRDSKCLQASAFAISFAWPISVGVDSFKVSSQSISPLTFKDEHAVCFIREPSLFSVVIRCAAPVPELLSTTAKVQGVEVLSTDFHAISESGVMLKGGVKSFSEKVDAVLSPGDSVQTVVSASMHREGHKIVPFQIAATCCRVELVATNTGYHCVRRGTPFRVAFLCPEVSVISRRVRVRFDVPRDALLHHPFEVTVHVDNLSVAECALTLAVDHGSESTSIIVEGPRTKLLFLEPHSSTTLSMSLLALQTGLFGLPPVRVFSSESSEEIYNSVSDNVTVFVKSS